MSEMDIKRREEYNRLYKKYNKYFKEDYLQMLILKRLNRKYKLNNEISIMKSVTLNEFVEVCMCKDYKSISIDLENHSVSILVGEERVEASELGYEVRINA